MGSKIKAVHCTECKTVLYIQQGRTDCIPFVPFPDLKFCPACGKEATQFRDLDTAWWVQMSYHYGVPVEAIKQVYRMDWIKTHRTFDAFWKEMTKND